MLAAAVMVKQPGEFGLEAGVGLGDGVGVLERSRASVKATWACEKICWIAVTNRAQLHHSPEVIRVPGSVVFCCWAQG